ncbi:hypothetical protein ACLOJK_013095 [Asimina triloba]
MRDRYELLFERAVERSWVKLKEASSSSKERDGRSIRGSIGDRDGDSLSFAVITVSERCTCDTYWERVKPIEYGGGEGKRVNSGERMMRRRSRCRMRSIVKVLPWTTLVLSHLLVSAVGDGDGPSPSSSWEKQGPNLAERAIGFTSSSKTWDKIRSWLNVVWMSGRSLHMDRRPDKFPSSARDAMTETVSQSIHSSKSAAENVARVADDVVHEGAEKMKRTVSNSRSRHEDSHEEL